MGEFDLIRRFFRRAPDDSSGSVLLGIGDDCALLQAPSVGQVLAVSSDMLIEGRHFFSGTDPAAIGHKSLAVNLSDLAAMGAEPVAFTLALAIPAVDEAWLAGFCAGMFSLADRHACPLVGGDTTRGPLTISVTVFGQVPADAALRRDGARAGDEIWVSGPLGGASVAVAARSGAGGARGAAAGSIDEGAARRLDWPQPQVALGLALRGVAHAAIDLSDGLAGDLRHLLTASSTGASVGAELITADIPLDPCLAGSSTEEALRHALTGGDDYELLFTAAARDHRAIQAACPAARMIGRVRIGRGILLTGGDGMSVPLEGTGFDHFSG